MITAISKHAKTPTQVDWKDTALIVVDVQNDFCKGGALEVPDADAAIPAINTVIEDARKADALIVYTHDEHPPKTKHFLKWPPHCVVGTWGNAAPTALDASHRYYKAADLIKGTSTFDDGYSAFDGTVWYEGETYRFLSFMRHHKISKLFIVGLATDYCVKSTALDAIVWGFDAYVYLPACRAVDKKTEEEAIEEMYRYGVELLEAYEPADHNEPA